MTIEEKIQDGGIFVHSEKKPLLEVLYYKKAMAPNMAYLGFFKINLHDKSIDYLSVLEKMGVKNPSYEDLNDFSPEEIVKGILNYYSIFDFEVETFEGKKHAKEMEDLLTKKEYLFRFINDWH